MIDQAIIERAGAVLDDLFEAVGENHPGFELIVRSNLDGHVFEFEGDSQVVMGTCRVFANLTGVFRALGGKHKAFKAYASSARDAIASVVAQATATEGSA